MYIEFGIGLKQHPTPVFFIYLSILAYASMVGVRILLLRIQIGIRDVESFLVRI